ncbi:MAG: ferritin-like domain-containing protein [Parafilimonas sp.]
MNKNLRSENTDSNGTNTNSVNKPDFEKSGINIFFKDQLKDIYWAEKTLVKTLPAMHNASSSAELKKAFSSHLDQTKQHVEKLEKVFNMIGEKPEAVKCAAMAGILSEGEEIINETKSDTAQRDIGLIFAGQKAMHYGIATYGGLNYLAKKLGKDDVADLLHKILNDTKDADELLTQVAEQNISYKPNLEPAEA